MLCEDRVISNVRRTTPDVAFSINKSSSTVDPLSQARVEDRRAGACSYLGIVPAFLAMRQPTARTIECVAALALAAITVVIPESR